MVIKLIIGNWQNDDVDITPTIKVRIGKKEDDGVSVKLTYIALCWLKYALVFGFYKVNQNPSSNR